MTIVKEIIDKFSEYPTFTHRDLILYFSQKKMKPANLTRLISHIKQSGKIYTLRKGIYTFKKDDMVSGFSYNPFYYGMLSALTIRELWAQNSRPEIITIKKVRATRVKIFNDSEDVIFVHHIPARYFFGFDIVKYGALKLPVSDPEKTLIDLFYYKIKLPIQNYDKLLQSINIGKVHKYSEAYDAHTAKAVLGFVNKYKRLADSGRLSSPY